MSRKTAQPAPPKTSAEWAAYRCKLSCRAACDQLNAASKSVGGISIQHIAIGLYHALHAIEDLATLIEEKGKQ